jgi:hypothetical protein
MADLLENAMNGKRRDGQVALIKHLKGQRLTKKQAIRAKCYDCDGMGETGTCEIKECSLYPYSSYKE